MRQKPHWHGLAQVARQSLNRSWWTENPMTYMAGSSRFDPGTREWFMNVDRRFFDAAFFARSDDGRPFGRFLTREIAAGKRVLEIGCGMGTHAALLIGAGANYTGVDLTEGAVGMTRRRLALFGLEGLVLQADAEDLPFPTASFDTVWSWGVIHHSASFDQCFDEIGRVLRPGGTVVLMVYHHPSLFYYLYCVLVRGVLGGELLHRSLDAIYTDQMDGAYARRFGRAELAGYFAREYGPVELDVVGQKEELYPLPRSSLKRQLVAATPDWFATALLCRLGHMIVARATRRQ